MSIQFLKICRLAPFGIGLLLAFTFSLVGDVGAQSDNPDYPQVSTPSGQSPFPGQNDQSDPGVVAMRKRQMLQQNADRQKQLVRDTEKLLALAQELKDEVAKTDKNTLSIDVVKKAGDIEKLAKSVKEKMKADYLQAP